MDYKMSMNRVRQVVNKYDPENLIEGGAPEDEYDAYITAFSTESESRE
jgi:hypothetical protein